METEARGPRLGAVVALAALFALGAWLRFSGLGSRPLAVDEYYFLQSIRAVLETGMPELPGGGLYVRGVILQYLTAGAIRIVGDPVVGLRLLPAILGLLSCLLLFVYARRRMGLLLASGVTVALLFSSWQLEFSRFGRMYAGLQLVTLVFVLLAGRAYATGSARSVYGAHLVALLSLGVHSLAVLFVPLLLPLSIDFRSGRAGRLRLHPQRLVATGVVALVALGMRVIPFRSIGVADPFPSDYVPLEASVVRTPGTLGFPNEIWVAAAIASLVVAGGAFVLAWLDRRTVPSDEPVLPPREVWALFLLAFSLLHMFLPALLVLAVLVVRYGLFTDSRGRQARRIVGLSAVVAIAWLMIVGALLVRGRPIGPFALPLDAGSSIGALRRIFFGWPDLHESFLAAWIGDLPLLTLVLTLSVAWRGLRALRSTPTELARDPAVVVTYFALVFGVVVPPYATVRYTYFLYPLALVVFAQALSDLGRWVVGADRSRRARLLATAMFLVVFGMSRDFNPRHVADLGTEEVAFRTGRWAGFDDIWYARSDYVSPARYIRDEIPAGEPVVLVNQPVVSYYLDRPHLQFIHRDRVKPVYDLVSRDRGRVYLWSGGPLAGTVAELRHEVGDERTIWFVDGVPMAPELEEFIRIDGRDAERVFRSVDGRLQVLRVNATPEVLSP